MDIVVDDSKRLEVALQFRTLADANFLEHKLGDAFFYYSNCLKMYPNWRADLKEKFFIVLSCWGQALEQSNNYVEIFHIYKEALEMYRDCAELYNNLGAHLLRLERADESVLYFKRALLLDGSFFPAYRNLHSANCALVERWHYRMLNDSCRNEAYRRAIAKKISQGFDSILDIGTGTGLFCLFAHQAGALKIYGCDYSSTMITIALQVLHKHGLVGRIKLVNKLSNNLKIPKDLPERVSLVVTETLDSCMLGERILHTLNHAWKYLLKPPAASDSIESTPEKNSNGTGTVIPHGGSLWLRLVQSASLAKNYMFPLIDTNADDCTASFANISLRDAEEMVDLRDLQISRINLRASSNEPYDTERLQDVADCKFLSQSHHLLQINFNDPLQIENCLTNKNRVTFDVICTGEGYLHAIGAWFDIQLDESISICSAPDGPNSNNCWDQAIFPCTKPSKVFAGSKVTISSDWSEGKVTLQVQQITHPNENAVTMDSSAVPVSVDCLTLLNDHKMVEHLKNSALKFLKAHQRTTLKIMDLYPIPVFGLTLLCNLASVGVACADAEVVCVVKSPAEEQLIRTIANSNAIPPGCLSFVKVDDFDAAIGGTWQQYFDAILVNFLESDGVINEEAVCRISSLKSLLKADGILLPKKIIMNGQLMNSDFIERSMRVVDDDIHKYGIGEYINEFQVPQVLDVNVATLKYAKYSNVCPFYAFSPENMDSEFHENHAVLAVQSGTINSILCWFDISILDDHSFYSSLYEFSYIHQTAFLPKTPILVQLNDYVAIDFVYHRGSFLLNLKKLDFDA